MILCIDLPNCQSNKKDKLDQLIVSEYFITDVVGVHTCRAVYVFADSWLHDIFCCAGLSKCQLSWASLSQCQLSCTGLSQCQLSCTGLSQCQLSCTSLSQCQLSCGIFVQHLILKTACVVKRLRTKWVRTQYTTHSHIAKHL